MRRVSLNLLEVKRWQIPWDIRRVHGKISTLEQVVAGSVFGRQYRTGESPARPLRGWPGHFRFLPGQRLPTKGHGHFIPRCSQPPVSREFSARPACSSQVLVMRTVSLSYGLSPGAAGHVESCGVPDEDINPLENGGRYSCHLPEPGTVAPAWVPLPLQLRPSPRLAGRLPAWRRWPGSLTPGVTISSDRGMVVVHQDLYKI